MDARPHAKMSTSAQLQIFLLLSSLHLIHGQDSPSHPSLLARRYAVMERSIQMSSAMMEIRLIVMDVQLSAHWNSAVMLLCKLPKSNAIRATVVQVVHPAHQMGPRVPMAQPVHCAVEQIRSAAIRARLQPVVMRILNAARNVMQAYTENVSRILRFFAILLKMMHRTLTPRALISHHGVFSRVASATTIQIKYVITTSIAKSLIAATPFLTTHAVMHPATISAIPPPARMIVIAVTVSAASRSRAEIFAGRVPNVAMESWIVASNATMENSV